MFRCHGNVSGRSIANTLHMICNRVLEEKRRVKEKSSKSQRQGSDLLNAPVSSSARSKNFPFSIRNLPSWSSQSFAPHGIVEVVL